MAKGGTPLDVIVDLATKAMEGSGDTKKALEGAKEGVDSTKLVVGKLKNLANELGKGNKKEAMREGIGALAIATLGYIFSTEDRDRLKEGRGQPQAETAATSTPIESVSATASSTAQKAVTAVKKAGKEATGGLDSDKKSLAAQRAVNMYAINYGPNGETRNSLAKKCKNEGATPDLKFIRENSYKLFEKGIPPSFDDFKKCVDKLVDASVTDSNERMRQAAVILSCCAVGCFQIIPDFHFKTMGWATRGEEGLRALYDFICSTDKQIDTFKGILGPAWKRYGDPAAVAVSYYAGYGPASEYKKDPTNPKFQSTQYGGHISIAGYGERARNSYSKLSAEFPGQPPVNILAMVMEGIETGGHVIRQRLESGQGIG